MVGGSNICVLVTGWHYPDEALMERETFAKDHVSYEIRKSGASERMDERQCAAYDAIIQHHGVERLLEPEAWFSNRRIVVRAGVGTDNVDMATWAKLHVPVTDVPDYGTHEVADHAIALMMTLARGVTQLDDRIQNIQR